mmetsp:Transcript_24191/g.83993  ORF Transcript_24191/g.83993 Transcript_24191/m.83993 type:complete len:446 (+) Transcript_24191:872-2209(+)
MLQLRERASDAVRVDDWHAQRGGGDQRLDGVHATDLGNADEELARRPRRVVAPHRRVGRVAHARERVAHLVARRQLLDEHRRRAHETAREDEAGVVVHDGRRHDAQALAGAQRQLGLCRADARAAAAARAHDAGAKRDEVHVAFVEHPIAGGVVDGWLHQREARGRRCRRALFVAGGDGVVRARLCDVPDSRCRSDGSRLRRRGLRIAVVAGVVRRVLVAADDDDLGAVVRVDAIGARSLRLGATGRCGSASRPKPSRLDVHVADSLGAHSRGVAGNVGERALVLLHDHHGLALRARGDGPLDGVVGRARAARLARVARGRVEWLDSIDGARHLRDGRADGVGDARVLGPRHGRRAPQPLRVVQKQRAAAHKHDVAVVPAGFDSVNRALHHRADLRRHGGDERRRQMLHGARVPNGGALGRDGDVGGGQRVAAEHERALRDLVAH